LSEVTQILSAIEYGDADAAEHLLPLVYDELRQLAAQKLSAEKPGQTLQPTALVHEAYIRLVDVEKVQQWQSRGHFFAAAAEAMRRILVERARRYQAKKRGGDLERIDLPDVHDAESCDPIDVLALNDALEKFQVLEPQKAQLVKLRYFTGCSLEETAQLLGISRATAERYWAYSRAWLFGELHPG
jgi:RNA polymerase sigma factor (TIGR02999 family)